MGRELQCVVKVQPTWGGALRGFEHAEHADLRHAFSVERRIRFQALDEPVTLWSREIGTTGPCLEEKGEIIIHGWTSFLIHSRRSWLAR